MNESVLWPELIEQWELAPDEVAYINLQQGFCCNSCKNNLRTMTLAAAVTGAFGFSGTFEDFCRDHQSFRQLTVTRDQLGQEFVAFSSDASQTCTPFFSGPRHAGDELRGFIHRRDHSFRHAGTRCRLEGGPLRMPACFEIGGPFVLHCADCDRSPHPKAAWITSELSRKARSEPGRLRCPYRIRRRFLVRNFRCRFSRSKSDKSDLPRVHRHPCDQKIEAATRFLLSH